MNRVCAVQDCGRPLKARGYCQGHYDRLRYNGDPLVAKRRSRTGLLSAAHVTGAPRGRACSEVFLPTQPLLAYADRSAEDLSAAIARTVREVCSHARVSVYVADRLCIALGVHPSAVYGNDWFSLEASEVA